MANELILIVEDNEKNLKLVRDVLQYKGYQTIEAGTGEDGVRLAKARIPDLVLMDIQLPGMDGLQATAILKADVVTRHIPVIALTALAMKGDEERILAAGCDGYIAKPLDYKDFLAVVKASLLKVENTA
jgi:two-component system cell cycle response regulator DivK